MKKKLHDLFLAGSVRPSSTVNSASIDPTGSAPQSSAVSATSINPARSVPVVASSTASPGQRKLIFVSSNINIDRFIGIEIIYMNDARWREERTNREKEKEKHEENGR